MKKEIKRGYMKWTDENGVFHKVLVEDLTQEELALESEEPVEEASEVEYDEVTTWDANEA